MRVKYLPQDVQARLDGGICFFQGKPFILYTLSGGETAELRPISGKGKSQIVSLKSEDLDISSPELGYINSDKSTFYLMRSPDRRYKQTLQTSSMVAIGTDGRTLAGDSVSGLLFSQAGEDMLLDRYPTLDEALAIIEGGKVKSVAINRNVCLFKDSFKILRVYFKGNEVGRIKPGTKVVTIPTSETAWVISKYLETFDWKIE